MKDNPIQDISLITAGISAPMWIDVLEVYLSIAFLSVGIVLGLIRIYTIIKTAIANK